MRRAGGWPALALAALACGADPGAAPPTAPGEAGPIPACTALEREGPPQQRPLLLVLADTLRRDRLGAYGGPARTPHFDAFAEAGHLFLHATSQAPWTKPSIATLFTGLHPSSHGVVSHPRLRAWRGGQSPERVLESDALGPEAVTLAEALAEAGYRTAAFVSNPWLQDEMGFGQGFGTYDDSFASNATPGAVVTRAGLDWLRSRPRDGRPWLLYLHYMDPHMPYAPVDAERMREALEALKADDRPLSRRARRWIARHARDPRGRPWVRRAGLPPNLALLELVYDQGVERFDAALGRLLEQLPGLPGAEEAAVVVVSDHGEALFQRGWRGHGDGLYEDEVGVPLAARLPGVRGPGVVACPVGLVDLRATLCDYLGVECPGPDQGVSLLGPGRSRYLVSEGVKGKAGNRAIRNARYKLVHRAEGPPPHAVDDASRRHALYDLVEDPAESRDLLAEGDAARIRPVFERLSRELEAAVAALEAQEGPEAPRVPLDAETRRRLEALGYLGAGDEPPQPEE